MQEEQLSILPETEDDEDGEVLASTPMAERETTIRRADDEDCWTLWSDDPGVVGAVRRLDGRPGVTVQEQPGGAVRATFPAKALKVRGLPKPPSTPLLGFRVAENALKTCERETIFERRRGADAWEVATTSPRVQEKLLAFVDGKAVTVRRSERRREELIFALPARAVRIVPATAAKIEAARRRAERPEVAAALQRGRKIREG